MHCPEHPLTGLPAISFQEQSTATGVLKDRGIFKRMAQISSQCLPDWKRLEVGWLSKSLSLMKGRGHGTKCYGLCPGELSLRSLPVLAIFTLKQTFP